MLAFNSSDLRALYIGGTGTISASCVRLSCEAGMQVSVLNRGRNAASRELPAQVKWLTSDVADMDGVASALGGADFDVVVNFLSYDAGDAMRWTELLAGRTGQYLHISSASVYGKPLLQVPVVESSPTHNRFSEYSQAKLRAEHALMEAYSNGFPVTIVRPSHTYDDAHPPLPGDWTTVARIARGLEIPVHGDGTSLWTLTHSEDFAQGLVGLLGNTRAIGEVFHITSEDVYTWDQIYTMVAEANGVPARLVHIPSEFFPVAAPDWGWSTAFQGDLAHSAVFDNTKIRRFVPGFCPRLTFERAATRIVKWGKEHPAQAQSSPEVDAVMDRLVQAYHRSREVFAGTAPAGPKSS